jgi:hypothetical protein
MTGPSITFGTIRTKGFRMIKYVINILLFKKYCLKILKKTARWVGPMKEAATGI